MLENSEYSHFSWSNNYFLSDLYINEGCDIIKGKLQVKTGEKMEYCIHDTPKKTSIKLSGKSYVSATSIIHFCILQYLKFHVEKVFSGPLD